MGIRAARPEDAAAMEAVRTAGWKAAYRGLIADAHLDALTVNEELVAARAALLGDPPPHQVALVAEHEGAVVGMAWLLPSRDEDLDPETAVELYALYVAPGSWAGGLGSRLLDEGFGRLPHPLQVLWTLEGNARARAFYERRGFALDGARKVRDLGGPAPEVRYRRSRP